MDARIDWALCVDTPCASSRAEDAESIDPRESCTKERRVSGMKMVCPDSISEARYTRSSLPFE